jgi:H(+)-transporting ATP synthase subunit D
VRGPAVRSRLIGLRREKEAAQGGRELLDRRREVLLRELQAWTRTRESRRAEAAEALGAARARLVEARVELGAGALEAACLAQPAAPDLQASALHVAGVRLPALRAAAARTFAPCYGPGGTSASLDEAGAGFLRALDPVVQLASADAAVRALGAALARTARLLNAVDRIVLPELGGEIRSVEAALEEEERDEAVRRRWRVGAKEAR